MTEILVTGGLGYIGSHCCVALMEAGYTPVVVDNLSNSSPTTLDRMQQISGVRPKFHKADVRDGGALDRIFAKHRFAAVIHFGALKAVGESVAKPLDYYDNNVGGTLTLIGAMLRAGLKKMIFSSSATVYGQAATVPIREDFPRSATNPYGRSKLIAEDILEDLSLADGGWRIARLRYFNPVGAHESGLIGENPKGVPNNLLPFICDVAAAHRDHLAIFGGDYSTPDGTGIRDYIHVMDLVEGHLAALRFLNERPGLLTVNLGTGKGISVLEMVRTFERVTGCDIPYRVTGRRPGDVGECWADPTLAHHILGWRAHRTLDDICLDAWRWRSLESTSFL
ncbi:UDP-glucose 4-epimerase GalE [Bradyrhizobium elkanii]|uniref:UDP-glucose 4-epimerase GalE n=1 Tax=Bradyrhizobium elkanii TaxID=29448 RepID=UPI003D1F1270